MVEIDFEDFVEEVKFQMTEFEELEEKVILDWEAKVRTWIAGHEDKKKRIIKSKNQITLMIRDEDVMEEAADKFHKAYKSGKTEEYWKKFSLL